MAKNKRAKTPASTETEVLTRSRRRCALCFGLHGSLKKKQGQIAHVDHDPLNYDFDNLAFLCLTHHNSHDSRTSQAKGFTEREINYHRDKLYEYLASHPNCLNQDRSVKQLHLVDLAFLEDDSEKPPHPLLPYAERSEAARSLIELTSASTYPGDGELPVLDIKLRNPSPEIVVLTKAVFTVKHIWSIHPVKLNKSMLSISEEYDVQFPEQEPVYNKSHPLSQSIPTNDADRFTLTLRPAWTDCIILASLELGYNNDEKLSCGDILFGMKDTGQWYWTATEEGIEAEENQITKDKMRENTNVKEAVSRHNAVASKVVRAFMQGEL